MCLDTVDKEIKVKEVKLEEEILVTVCADCPFEGRFTDEDCRACQRNLRTIAEHFYKKGQNGY